MTTKNFEERFRAYLHEFHPVVPFNPGDGLLLLDFTSANHELTEEIINNTDLFIQHINAKLTVAGARYGIGGYNEHRTIYSRSELFGRPIPNPSQPRAADSFSGHAREGLQIELSKNIFTGLSSQQYGKFGYQWADPFYYNKLKEFAIQHRSVPTQAEEILWHALKGNKLENYKFRRQHIIDKYIADLVCLDKSLIIEIDGLIHALPENMESDKERTKALKKIGFSVLRLSNEEVLNNLKKSLEIILQKLNNLPSIKEKSNLSSPFGGQGAEAEPRRLHLGIDIWGKPYTKVMAPLDGIVHSFAFNNAHGDYGTTIIISHQLDGFVFHTLYGHLSLNSISNIHEGDVIRKGDVFAAFGIPFENGHWPPHLHFQIVIDMQEMKGDYPGVCQFSEREKYLANCPDPDLILGMMKYVT